MSMMNFIKNRKKENRQSLIIDNLDLDKFNENLQLKRSNSISELASISESDVSHTNTNITKEISNVNTIKQIYEPEQTFYNKEKEYQKQDTDSHVSNSHHCNLCFNKNNIKDAFMILTCGHIFHIRCLVDNHYSAANKSGVIDEEYFNSRCCLVCNNQMEMEDILYIHNKFYKNTKEYLVKQDQRIEILDKQMTKLKDELRICYEYKQKLEHQREKSKQITITINTLM